MDPIAHHFLLCLKGEYDPTDRVTPYSLRHLVFRLRTPPGGGYPFALDE